MADDDCDMLKLPEDTQLLYDLVTNACNGIPMFPVRPECITSTDESTQFIFKHHRAHHEKITFVTKESNGVRGMNAVYKFDGGKDMCGMRVKLTLTFNGTGQCIPLFITVSGLNDRELPPDKDLVALKRTVHWWGRNRWRYSTRICDILKGKEEVCLFST